MATKKTGTKSKREASKPIRNITLLAAEKPTDKLTFEAGELMARVAHGARFETVNLWVREPDSDKLTDVQVAARLCSCRSVCLAVIEDSF